MRVLVLGSTGLLGSHLFKVLSQGNKIETYGTIRSKASAKVFNSALRKNLLLIDDATDMKSLGALISKLKPQVVVNCLALNEIDLANRPVDYENLHLNVPENIPGMSKEAREADASNIKFAQTMTRRIPIEYSNFYSRIPHEIAGICQELNARYIHISTDGVFSGDRFNYDETDDPDPTNLEGTCKLQGEVVYGDALTIRTSFFGHTVERNYGLVDWFLGQEKECFGYNKYIFSGMPAVILSMIIRDVVVPSQEMKGLYNIGAPAISKYALLELIADVYQKSINVIKKDSIEVNRSLDSTKFFKESDYKLPSWREMIESMYSFK